MIGNMDEVFSRSFLIEFKNLERKYFGLEEVNLEWEVTVSHSNKNSCYRRMT
jgi:hypothetical protein